MSHENRTESNGWKPRLRLAFFGFAAVGGLLLLAEHRVHLLPWLPWLLLAACPLMHVFMHRGHSRHGQHSHRGSHESSTGSDDTAAASRPTQRLEDRSQS